MHASRAILIRSQTSVSAGIPAGPAREKASQQARLARHADADPHDDASEHDASRHDAHGARPCALFLSAHLASSCSIFTWGSHPSSSGCAHGLCTWGCAWGASRVGLVHFGSVILFGSLAVRPWLAAAMLADVLCCLHLCFHHLCIAALLASFFACCFIHRCSHRVLFCTLSSSPLSCAPLLRSSLARSQRGSQLRCAA